ncbi:hypothetical protein TVAG_012460 [Trichomonas vaginalis G3]|uniref:CCR4-NOT transcription complex subunit 11 n=1 Tax=Trichomonas vaginalis (strain ATCC PRA-98 / G3) TaxID=412133 RepID=A2E8Z6_TRIV3|nr:gene silencing by RNA [Trichomonas vaginalis G3]EAY10880.1 hypothetical protein TVAG_012460 [Trichomonas vaginalis G3]KAI5482927.1 gene silencing by RNA [Trichomonas vaginalis G3]|eukprot:XP_001323103.1 hypothetical protein [Trichomonas vaginalis G3]
MIRQAVAELVIEILNNGDDTLETVSSKFNADFDFNDRISALTGISLLLTDGLLNYAQQIVGVYILFNEGKSQPTNPFAYIYQTLLIVHQSNPNFISPQLHEILSSVLNGNGFGPAAKESANTILSAGFTFPSQKEPILDKTPSVTPRISPVIVSNTPDTNCQHITHDQALLKILTSEIFWSNFEAPFIRPIPEIAPIFEGELSPIYSYATPEFLFDASSTTSAKSSILLLIAKAADTKLKPNESNVLISEFKRDSSIYDESKFPLNRFASLIENNPDVAKEIVVTLGNRKPSILKNLQSLDVTVNSIEVVRHFVLSGSPPADFLQGYAKNSIKLIQSLKDGQSALRKTRIFTKVMSIFKTSNYPFTPELVSDLKAFCTELASKSIKEAQDLLNML